MIHKKYILFFLKLCTFKVIVQPKMKILSLILTLMSFQTRKDLRSSSEHKLRYFWWNLRALRPSIDSKGPYTIKVQKHSKEIGKIIQVTSGVNRNFTKLREYFLCETPPPPKKRLYSNLSPPRHPRAVIFKPVLRAPPTLHIFCVSLIYHTWFNSSAH